MGKIRIYELARDLNMTNKVLVEKIRNMNIPVKSHMSSLDEETVALIKSNEFDKKIENVEITRVKPTVIRKRRKAVRKKTEQQEALHEADGSYEKITDSEKHLESVPKHHPPTTNENINLKQQPLEISENIDLKQQPHEISENIDLKQQPLEISENIDLKQQPLKISENIDLKQQPLKINENKKEELNPLKLKRTKAKKVKRSKKDTPAKIIRLPVNQKPKATEIEKKPENKEIKIKAHANSAKKATANPVNQPEIKKTKPEITPKEKNFSKKKNKYRKNEIIEKDKLYDKGFRNRKSKKNAKHKITKLAKTQITTPKANKRRIKIDDVIVLSDLSNRMGVKASEVIKALMALNVMATVNQTIDFDTASLVATEFDYELEKAFFEEETILKAKEDDPEKLSERPAVVTVMGHVDHGKTSLLDVIRKTKVTDNEAGGITQHIGAYLVATEKGKIVFLDTPGHEAFSAMRARGSKLTDIVVLVVAADDGVMPQTIEAINHAKAANVHLIVAVNKIDKANADPERVYRELSEIGVVPEEWGGEAIFVKVSAKQNQGIDDLLEMILLQAELLELKANPSKLAVGYAIEAKLDAGRGAVATLLIQEGSLNIGDSIVCGIHHGKVRAMLNDKGEHIKTAGPSTPVEILGLTGVPNAGDEIVAIADEKNAKQLSIHRINTQRIKELAKTNRLSLDKLFEKLQEGQIKSLNIIIKADVQGSIEALNDTLTKLSNEEVKINIIHSATGTVTESDISLAAVSNSIIIGFNVRPTPKVQAVATKEHIDMRFYNIIYDVINDINNAIIGLMASTFEEQFLGRAEVREVFHVPKIGTIAGCYVTDGTIERGSQVRLIRDGIVCYEGKIASLRRFKDDVKEVLSGYECGIGIEKFNDIKTKDAIECYHVNEIKPALQQ